MKHYLGYALGLALWIALLLLAYAIHGDVKPDLTSEDDSPYSPCYENGHPLWQDC